MVNQHDPWNPWVVFLYSDVYLTRVCIYFFRGENV